MFLHGYQVSGVEDAWPKNKNKKELKRTQVEHIPIRKLISMLELVRGLRKYTTLKMEIVTLGARVRAFLQDSSISSPNPWHDF